MHTRNLGPARNGMVVAQEALGVAHMVVAHVDPLVG